PALARGEMQCVGATTLDEYRKYIERDTALERRFQAVYLEEPSVEETVEILKMLRPRYEAHHKVDISDAALVAAAKLSDRYITGRQLPDKAIDFIDEAAAKLRIDAESLPADMKTKEERIRQLTDQEEAAAQRSEYERAAELRTERVRLEQEYEPERQRLLSERNIDMVVDEVDIAELVSKWTGIPTGRLLEGEGERLVHMEENLHHRIIGQKEAVVAVAEAIRRSRSGLSDPKRPIGSFIFLGPTGVGKTELAKALSQFMFDDEQAMVRIDMSEYMEKHSVSRLIGAPPGYVGYDEGGQLTEAVRRRPYAVVLLDEIEKAHPDVFNILLQVIDDGRLTDNQGRTVDFKNCVLLMTSNIGSQALTESVGEEGTISEGMRREVMNHLREAFRPEFLNRVDETVLFSPLTRGEITEITALQFERICERLRERMIQLEATEEAISYIGEAAWDPVYGARPIKRYLQKHVESALARRLVEGAVAEGSLVRMTLKEGEIDFEIEAPALAESISTAGEDTPPEAMSA
ncbi:MAG TPA: AAA family ATPase, partial [Candidatus Latescibacteria bacterium]|nr:AAA family ATPase [Candidatus Latescibacterota bacterium]